MNAEPKPMHEDQGEIESKRTLGATTLIPIGLAAAIAFALFQGYREISAQFLALRDQITDVKIEIRDLKSSLALVQGTRWTAQDMEIYALKMKLNNPTIIVPEIGDIIQRRSQEGRKP